MVELAEQLVGVGHVRAYVPKIHVGVDVEQARRVAREEGSLVAERGIDP